jgi:hypothetical protein
MATNPFDTIGEPQRTESPETIIDVTREQWIALLVTLLRLQKMQNLQFCGRRYDERE